MCLHFRASHACLQLCEEPEFNGVQNGGLISTCLDKLMVSYNTVREFQKSQDWTDLQARVNLSPLAQKLLPNELKSFIDILGTVTQCDKGVDKFVFGAMVSIQYLNRRLKASSGPTVLCCVCHMAIKLLGLPSKSTRKWKSIE